MIQVEQANKIRRLRAKTLQLDLIRRAVKKKSSRDSRKLGCKVLTFAQSDLDFLT